MLPTTAAPDQPPGLALRTRRGGCTEARAVAPLRKSRRGASEAHVAAFGARDIACAWPLKSEIDMYAVGGIYLCTNRVDVRAETHT